jgi:hypothetical protein
MDDGDTVGHGTQVASLVCGKTLGVAKNAKVFMIRIWRKGARGAKLDDREANMNLWNRLVANLV